MKNKGLDFSNWILDRHLSGVGCLMPNILMAADATAGVTTDALVRVLGMTWTLVWGWFVWSCTLVTAYRR